MIYSPPYDKQIPAYRFPLLLFLAFCMRVIERLILSEVRLSGVFCCGGGGLFVLVPFPLFYSTMVSLYPGLN